MEEIEQRAYLLHSRPFRDSQVIAEFITKHQGKVSAIVYVSTSLKSNKKALLQPFIPLNIVLKGRGNLKTLSRIEAAKKSFLLTGDHLYSGFYLNELQVRLLGEHIPYDDLFNQYHQSIALLAEQAEIEPVLRNFEHVLLDELGLAIDYSNVFEQDHQYFYYLPDQGFMPIVENSESKLTYNKAHLMAIAQQDFSNAEIKNTYKLLMRQVINHLLGGKALNSRKLFKRN